LPPFGSRNGNALHTLVELWLAVILRAPRALSQALYEMLEGSERLLDDVKEVLNLNRVYAAGMPPQAISPARFFPKLAAASHCYALFEVWFLDAQRANRGRRLRPPPMQQHRFARVALDAILVEARTGRRRKRGFCAARKHWKSSAHVRGGN
jgi:hypothetical protein